MTRCPRHVVYSAALRQSPPCRCRRRPGPTPATLERWANLPTPSRCSRRYAEIVDTRTFDALDEVFTTEAELGDRKRATVGLDEIRRDAGLHRYEATDHRVGASTFTVDGERATGTVECEAHHWSTNGSGHRTDRVMTITYYDRYEQTPAGWRLTHPTGHPPHRRSRRRWTRTP